MAFDLNTDSWKDDEGHRLYCCLLTTTIDGYIEALLVDSPTSFSALELTDLC